MGVEQPATPPYRPSTERSRRLRTTFHYLVRTVSGASWSNVAEVTLDVPLLPEAANELEALLRQQLALPEGHTVFGIRALSEPSAPALPSLLLHGLADPLQPSLALSVVVRPLAQLTRQPVAPLEAIPLASLQSGCTAACLALLHGLQLTGTARLRGGPELAARTRAAYAALPAFFEQPASCRPPHPTC